jgi:hypothetical protein
MARLIRIAQVVLLAAVAVLLWGDWRARRLDAERWRRLDRIVEELGRASSDGSPPPGSLVTAAATMAVTDREALAQRIVGLIRATLPASAAAGTCACDEKDRSPSAKAEPRTFGPDEDGKAREAEQIVAASLASGHLRVEDVMRLRNLELASKGHPGFAGMRARIFGAINNQKLVAEDMAFVAF